MARLPQLRGLQAFDAAARHLSFKKAAEELNVTPTAISHLIKALEDDLGLKLFNRLTRSLSLTQAGEVYAPHVHEAFRKLEEASLAITDSDASGPIHITTTKTFASKWLSPRLHTFSAENQEFRVKLDASDMVRDFAVNNIDIAIRHGTGDYGGQYYSWILDNYVAPVCSPDLFESGDITPEDLLKHPLIVYEWSGFCEEDPDWEKWFAECGIEKPNLDLAETYSDEHICVQAALDGRGIALTSLLASASHIEAGRLIVPVPVLVKDKSYYLVCNQLHSESKKVKAFENWLLEEADTFRDTAVGALMEKEWLKDNEPSE
ncbi:transcriptional regulator GcvA [Kordiimonas sp. SCSIO 12603]|uniref:transcriptional regulator GcvA n=1 Tax=Kordiimonas sp. SCSIO 12603 TaxID=2829596 RepID=UPI002102B4C3|nr:transcriptional regulator GcvA [Kordiimonas sp. SCSIO 12603]UTW60345.1 transcriptional regulator GcvA [Kordiimonas sp. SCSIO 12603]